MSESLNLPTNLFNPDRMPPRDEDGYVCHPDWDLIYDQLGDEDEGQSTNDYLKTLGYEFYVVDLEDDAPQEIQDRHFGEGDPNISDWQPTTPDGEGWKLLAIYMHEDGSAACFIRMKP